MIDLHTHSTFSDGSLSPEELVTLAAEAKLSAVALTDHDTTDGVPCFLKACERVGIEGIPGVEISVDFEPGTMHMLGYFMDIHNVALQSALQNVKDGREKRNHQILKKLCGLGMELNWEEVAALAGSDVIGRPHIVQALIARGYIKTKDEAFNKFLGKGKSAYVERFRLSIREGIDCIRNAGGVPVLAHPFTLGLSFGELRRCASVMAGDGLQGIEVYYSMHNNKLRSQYMSLVKEFSLVATGGSDFHGAMNPSIRIGRGFGNVKVDDSVLVRLRKCIA